MIKKTTESKPATWKCANCPATAQGETKPPRGTCPNNSLGHVWRVQAK